MLTIYAIIALGYSLYHGWNQHYLMQRGQGVDLLSLVVCAFLWPLDLFTTAGFNIRSAYISRKMRKDAERAQQELQDAILSEDPK